MDYAQWLIFIQGKNIPQNVLESIKTHIGPVTPNMNKKQLYDSVIELMSVMGYQDDVKHTFARYIYEHLLGFHIKQLSLETENKIIQEYEKIKEVLQNDTLKIPNIYILQKISEKYDLDVCKTIEYPSEKRNYFDSLLEFYTST